MAIATIAPTTGETIKAFDELSDAEIEARIARAVEAFAEWRLTPYSTRAAVATTTADLLDQECDDVARLMTTEMGKPVAQARAEVKKCASVFRFFAEHAEQYLATEPVTPTDERALCAEVQYHPLGPVLAVMPWNFPLWQVTRFAAPALMAGNVGLLKHASNVPQTALYLEDVLARAGLPEGCFQTLLIGSAAVEWVLRDRRVRAVTLTGSEGAGIAVASVAGEELKKTVLELGGSDAFVVLPSADLETVVPVAVTARTQNNGQSCIAAKRFIVHEDVADAFLDRFVAAMTALRVGDPLDEEIDIGPLATQAGRDDVAAQVADAADHGASVLCGGSVPDGPGWFYPPTVITDITPVMRVAHEEVFGPVALVFRVRDVFEAIAVANDTEFGLGASVWTIDADEQARAVRDLDAGMVFVNGMVASYPEVPFGGVKRSGYGRELSAFGIREFCNIKTVWVGGA